MSIVMPSDSLQAAEVERRLRAMPGRQRHTLVFFGGAESGLTEAGHGLTVFNSHGGQRTCAKAYEDLATLVRARGGDARGIDPELDNGQENAAIRRALAFIKNRELGFDPRGKLVIYGYSAGGYNAVNLCKRMMEEFRSYVFLPASGHHDGALSGRRLVAQVRVDLLVTVDPCIQDYEIERGLHRIPLRRPNPIVKYHANYYQQVFGAENPQHYAGVSIPTADSNCRRTPSREWSPHDQMPLETYDHVSRDVVNVLAGGELDGCGCPGQQTRCPDRQPVRL